MNGIIIINKPKDYTSFDVVAVMRKLLNTKKIGHTGTLDPLATGVLPILIGRAAKLQNFIPDTNKEYIASFRLGITTDTLDITGKTITSVTSNINKEQIENTLSKFRGNISQVPPMFSAVQKNGVRLYDLARKGLEVEREARPVTIFKLKLIEFDESLQSGKLLVNCSKGTYIRTLCDDIGKSLKVGAILTDLQRTKACSFDIKSSITLDFARELAQKNSLEQYVLPCDIFLKDYKKAIISPAQETRFKNGGTLSLDRINNLADFNDNKFIRIYSNPQKKFIGLGKINKIKNEISVACLIDIQKNT